MPDTEKQWYDLVKHNLKNPDRATTAVLDTVRGLERAQQMADVLDGRLTPEEKKAGFAVFWEQGKKPIGFKKHRKLPNQRPDRRQ
jgi:hypothetical protein